MTTRWKASGIHFLMCLVIASSVISIALLVWYPAPLFSAMGGQKIVLLVLGIDVVLGPILTWIIYKPLKKGLKFDLAVIAILQISALMYGLSVLFQGRPVYLVFVKDRINVVTAVDIDPDSLARAESEEFREMPLTGPKLVAAKSPSDPKQRERILFAAINQGRDLHCFPEFYQAYEKQLARILERAQPLAELRAKRPESAALIDPLLERTGTDGQELTFLPLETQKIQDLTAVIDPANGAIVEILDIDPWI